MRLPRILAAGLLTAGLAAAAVTAAAPARADTASDGLAASLSERAAAVLDRMREGVSKLAAEKTVTPAPAAIPSGIDRPITGTPQPSGHAITGKVGRLLPSEQLAGRQAALRFRFQQQMQSGERPWLPPIRRD